MLPEVQPVRDLKYHTSFETTENPVYLKGCQHFFDRAFIEDYFRSKFANEHFASCPMCNRIYGIAKFLPDGREQAIARLFERLLIVPLVKHEINKKLDKWEIYNQLLVAYDQRLAERDEQIARQDEQIARQDEQIATYNQQRVVRDQRIKEFDAHMKEVDAEIKKIEAENEKYKANLEKDSVYYAEKAIKRERERAELAIKRAESKIREEELERDHEERRLEVQRIHERAMNHPIFIVGQPIVFVFDFVATHGTNAAIAFKNITQNALIATRDTVVKTARVAKENISKLVFFCSYALVRVKSSGEIGDNYNMQRHVDSGKPIQFYFQSILERQNTFKQDSQNTSRSPSLVAQLLCNEKKM